LNKPYLNFALLENLPPEAAADKAMLEKKGIKSALLLPYQIGGRTVAGITFDSMKEERTFSENFISLAKLLGEIIAGAFYRMRMEEKYQEMRKKLAEAGADSGIGELSLLPETEDEFAYADIVGRCPAMKFIYARMEQIAPTDSSVLILGETGTGKGVIARAIHDLSLRKKKRMVTVNCAALPLNLIESELFGREKGAFTGADSRRIGRFELAHQGSLMLDEIADLPLELQTKLLRVIQDGEFERLGSSETLKVDVRILAVTSKDLKKEVAERRFRQDLYYRLNVFPIVMPPLRERKEDIPLLADHFLKKFSGKMRKDIRTIPRRIIEDLISYSWPGNVRELEHVIERAVIVTTGTSLRLAEKLAESGADEAEETFVTNLGEMEKRHILKVLEKTDWRIEGPKGAAILLGLHPNTLRGRMQKLGIRLRRTAS
jgi:transcriptional regulator with GAF, ATPase, and Fis domain